MTTSRSVVPDGGAITIAAIVEPPVAAPVVVDAARPTPGLARPYPLRREGPDKLTGRAVYVDDLVVPGAWYGATVRSTEAHARLLGIELDPAFDWSGVVVVTAADIPGENIIESIQSDQPVLLVDEIRHHAEPVALLAAPDRETLRAARGAIRLVTQPLPAVFDPLESDHAFARYEMGAGDVDQALASADRVIEGTYRVGHQEQLYIENQGMIAIPRDDGGVTVHGSLQCPYYVHPALKRALALSDSQAVVIQTETGGGFGGKEEYPSIVAVHAALLARRSGHPVRMIYERHEDIAATTKRHPAVVRYRTGVSRSGMLVAQDVEVIMDGGAYCTLSPVVLSRGVLHAGGPYRCPNVRIRGRAMATNTPPNGAFRGFGAPQVEFAAEMQANRAADALGMSPLELRRLWVYDLGDTTPTGQVLRESVAGREVLERAAESAEFERVRERTGAARASRGTAGPSGRTGLAHGIGLALAWHGAGFTGSGEVKLASVVYLDLGDDGRPAILIASTEMGQGTKTIFPQLVAAELGIGEDEVDLAPVDTSVVPDSGPTVASRTAMVVGGLVVTAARRLREQVESATGRPFSASAADYARDHGPVRIEQRFEPYPGIHFDDATYAGDAYPAYGWAAAVAEVDVDLDTGEVAVRSVVAADDVGRVIHPVLAAGQVEGGTLQAVGYATIEEMKLADGRYLNDRLATYLIPTALDAPRIETILVEAPYSGAPHGAKGVGELPMDVGAPAVVAAIHDATGVWVHDLPATPERILAALGAAAMKTRATRPAAPASPEFDAFRRFEAEGWEDRAASYLASWSLLTRRFAEPLLDAASVGEGVRVLDVGTGGGDVAAAARARGAVVSAVDASAAMVAVASERLGGVEVLVADAESLPFAEGTFDAVVANFLVPHLPDHAAVLASLVRVARSGGRIALTTWDHPDESRRQGIVRDAIADIAPEAPAGLPPGPDFYRYSDDDAFRELLDASGLREVRVDTIRFRHRYASFDALWRSIVEGTVRARALVVGHPPQIQAAIRARAGDLARTLVQHDGTLLVPVSVKLASGVVP